MAHLTNVLMANLWKKETEQREKDDDATSETGSVGKPSTSLKHANQQKDDSGIVETVDDVDEEDPEEEMDAAEQNDDFDEMTDEELVKYLSHSSDEEQRAHAVWALHRAFTKLPEKWSSEHPKEKLPPSISSFAQYLEEKVEPLMSKSEWVQSQQRMVRMLKLLSKAKPRIRNANVIRLRKKLLRRLVAKINKIYVTIYADKIKRVESSTLQSMVELGLLLVPRNKPAEKAELRTQLTSLKLHISQLQESPRNAFIERRKQILYKIVEVIQKTCKDWLQDDETIPHPILKFIDVATSTFEDFSKHWEKCQKLLIKSMKLLIKEDVKVRGEKQKRIDVLMFALAQSLRDFYKTKFNPYMGCFEHDTFLFLQKYILSQGLDEHVVLGDGEPEGDEDPDEENDFEAFTPQKRAKLMDRMFFYYTKICRYWVDQYEMELPYSITLFGAFLSKIKNCQEITPWFWRNARLFMQQCIIRAGCPDFGSNQRSDDIMKERYLSRELLRMMSVFLRWYYGDNFQENMENQEMYAHLESLCETRRRIPTFDVNIQK